MTRIVIDTNIFISSFFGGNPKKIIDLWKSGRITLCFSKQIMNEYTDVLTRIGLGKSREIRELYGLVEKNYHILFIFKPPVLDILKDNPDRNMLVECAACLKAEYIISSAINPNAISHYMGIRIVTPEVFLDTIEKEDRSS